MTIRKVENKLHIARGYGIYDIYCGNGSGIALTSEIIILETDKIIKHERFEHPFDTQIFKLFLEVTDLEGNFKEYYIEGTEYQRDRIFEQLCFMKLID